MPTHSAIQCDCRLGDRVAVFYKIITIIMNDQQNTIKEWNFKNEKGESEKVALEKWIWGVIYQDGTELKQFDAQGIFHQFREIDQAKIRLFVMINVESGQRFDLLLPPGAELIHFYRICGTITGGEEYRNKVYVFGYKNKWGKKHLHYILPNGTLLIADREVNLENFGAFNKLT